MNPKQFWTHKTIAFLVVFFSVCSLLAEGIAKTAELFVVILGMLVTYKIIAREKI